MNFKFVVNITERDYIDFNIFHATRSKYGRKMYLITELFVLFAIIILPNVIYFLDADYSFPLVFHIIRVLIVDFIFLFLIFKFFKKLYGWTIKLNINVLKKAGKMSFDPTSSFEFYDDIFTESTPETKCEYRYSILDSISIVGTSVIYLHTSNLGGYIIPFTVFDSKEHFDSFVHFLHTKCNKINFFQK